MNCLVVATSRILSTRDACCSVRSLDPIRDTASGNEILLVSASSDSQIRVWALDNLTDRADAASAAPLATAICAGRLTCMSVVALPLQANAAKAAVGKASVEAKASGDDMDTDLSSEVPNSATQPPSKPRAIASASIISKLPRPGKRSAPSTSDSSEPPSFSKSTADRAPSDPVSHKRPRPTEQTAKRSAKLHATSAGQITGSSLVKTSSGKRDSNHSRSADGDIKSRDRSVGAKSNGKRARPS